MGSQTRFETWEVTTASLNARWVRSAVFPVAEVADPHWRTCSLKMAESASGNFVVWLNRLSKDLML